jgi:protein gp37
MSDKSSIEWTDATWNPVSGCTKVSPGCDYCYAERFTERFHGKGSFATVRLHPDRLDLPLRWREPRKVFVNSMSDLFHADVPDEFIARVFAVMFCAPRHTFQVLTKRHARMRALLDSHDFVLLVDRALYNDHGRTKPHEALSVWPLPNVWLGVSVENQQWADIRIPALLETPAAMRFLSCEPLLGPVDPSRFLNPGCHSDSDGDCSWRGCPQARDAEPATSGRHCPFDRWANFGDDWDLPQRPISIDWVIVGGESGPGARPIHPQWARDIRDQCVAAGVPFLFKQWGEWVTEDQSPSDIILPATSWRHLGDDQPSVYKVGKKAAGRELDGRTWDEYPAVGA